MSANAWEVAGTEPDAPAAADPWTVAAVEPDSTALARGADADDHASPVARTESRMGDALHTARQFLLGSTPEEEASGDYKVGVIPSVKESLGEEFKLPSLSDVGTTLKTTAARVIGGSKLQSLEELKQAHLNDAKLPAERRALWADPDFIKLNEAIDQEKATLGEVSKDEQGVSERNQGFWQQAALNAAGSLEMSAPSLAAGVLTRNPELAVASMYSPTAATSYSQRRQAGVAPELAAKSAAIDGVLEVGTELLPAHALFKQGTGPFKRMVNFLSHELPGESAAQIGQNLNQYLTELAGEATAKDVVDNLWMSVQQLPQVAASVALAGGAQVGVANLAEGKHAPSVDEQGRQAEEFARRAAPDLGTPAPQLEAPKTPADFEITPEGTAKRPGEEVPEPKALPAPQGSGTFVAGEQGTRELTQADERARQQAREERASLGSDNVTRVPLEALQAIQDGTATKEQVGQARSEGLVSTEGALLPVGRRQIKTLKRAKLQASVTAETDPQAITVVPGEQGLHGVAIGGKPQAWYSSKKIATEEAQALRSALPEVKAAAPAVESKPDTVAVLGQEIETPATPTDAQKDAGNYRKPTIKWNGLDIAIENVPGQIRKGMTDQGKPFERVMQAPYGYVKQAQDTGDGKVDVFMGEKPQSQKVFVIDQLSSDGKTHDEPKAIVGTDSAKEAKALYLANYQKGWQGFGGITEMTPAEFKDWSLKGDVKQPLAWKPPKGASEAPVVAKNAALPAIDDRLAAIDEQLRRMEEATSKAEKSEETPALQRTTDSTLVEMWKGATPERLTNIYKSYRKDLRRLGKRDEDNASDWDKWSGHAQAIEQIANERKIDLAGAAKPQKIAGFETNNGEPELIKKLIKQFGTTRDVNEAGYILPTGAMLDLSGKRQGGSPGQRALDHREAATEENQRKHDSITQAMFATMEQSGTIRVQMSGDEAVASIVGRPADAALRQLAKMGDVLTVSIHAPGSFDTLIDRQIKHPTADNISRLIDVASGDKEEPAFRKSDQAAKGQPVAEVKAAVDTILSRFKVKPDLHVVQNFNDLPAPMLKVLAGQKVKDGDITAFYFKSGVYVIADQIKSMSEIPNTIAHEYIAHLGLRSALPRAEYVPILEGIAKDMPMEVRRRGHVEFGNNFDLKNDFHRQRAAEETLAYYAGEYMSGNSIPERIKRWVQKFIGLLRDWTRDVLGMPKLHDETFIKQLLVDLETHLKSGEGHAQAATEEPAFTTKQPTFYSALTRAAETAKREKGTGKEWLATLKNMPGIKQEEIEATDLEQFLGDRVKISRQEVVDYLNHNGVQVTEKILGDQPTVEFKEFIASTGDSTHTAHIDGIEQRYPFIRYIASNNTWWVQTAGGIKTQAPDYATAHAIAMDALHNTLEPATRYSQYTLPGGERYRELLLTLPARDNVTREHVKNPPGWGGGPNEDEGYLEHGNTRADYRSSHWEEPNVLAHIRFDTREVQVESAKENNLGEKFLELASGVTPINGTLKIVNRGVQGMRQHAQISKAIVEAVPVDVVNSLRALKLSPEKLFSNNSVSAAFAAMPVNVRDRVINGIAAATMKTEALIRAKVLRSLSTGLDAELLPAMRTSDLDAGYVSSLLSSDETGESAILQGLESNDSGARSAASSATSIGTGSDERSAANLANLLNAHADIVRSSLVNANRHDKRTIRVMHIAEIQSDLHQAGRKIGYVTSSSGPYGATRDGRDGKWYVKNFETGKIEGLGLQTEELANASAVSRYNVDRLPNFPFKTTWVDLAVKRAIRFASENGFDRISWDSGATNAERYDLSKQVDGVRVMEATAADSVHLFIQTKGNTQWTRIAGNSVVKRDGLADAIGKELAEKALKKVDAGEIAEFHGLDLKVGGEGQKGFYDRIVPTATKRLVKKYGAQLSESRLNDADAVTEEDRRTRPIATAVAAGELPILGFDITDAMRSAAMEGQPLFQRNAQVDTQEFKRWFGNSKVVDAKGKPLVVYHGTNKNINEFLTDRELRHGDLDGIGAWFAENTELADAVIDFKRSNQSILGGGRKKTSKGSIIYPAYVSIKNPFVVGNIEALKHTIATAMIGENPDQFSPFEVQQKYIRTLGDAVRSLNNKSAKYFLEKHGYDGILIKDDKGYGSSWVAFHPNQVKSAIGNSGAFDPTNADIRFQRTSQTMPLRDEPNKPEWKVSGYQALATKAIDAFDNKLGWYYGPLGKLPEQNAYLKGRYLALGDIGAIRKVARHIFDALKGASTEDAAAVYDFMTTRDAAPDNIVDQKIMATAVQAKQLIAEQGQRLYDAGLLSDEAMERYAGEYLPRMYLKHVLGDQMFSEMGYGKKISSQGNLKMRKDIPIETRKFILGEITDPAFLASFSVSRVGRDLAMMDFLDFVSHNQAWVPPQMMVEWNGKKVSPYWVTSEAARLRRQANFIKDHPSAGKMREIADRMDALADRAKGKLDAGVELTDFKQIPDTARYGMLRGLWIRKEIYEDLVGAQTFIEPKSFEGMVQRTSGKIMRAFKFSKVSANLPSHFRNMMGNAIMLHLSGVPFQRVYSGEIFLKAISSILHKDEYYQIAQKHGMSESSFNNNELASIRDEWLAMQESESLGNGPAKIKAMFGRVTNAIGDIYQFEEELGKLAKLRDAMERQGMPEDDAMIEAHKWTFDYSLIPRWLKFIRNTPLGAPFFTYSYKAFPRMGEALVRRPWAYLPYLAAPYLMAELMKYLWGADDDDLKKARQAAPTWMQSQGGMQLLPWKDEAGRLQMLNLGYITPWGMLADMGAQAGNNDLGGAVASTGLLSGPVPNVIAAVKTGIDPFTKKPIVPKGASPREGMEAITQYAWDMAMPGMFGSRGWYAKMRQLQKGEVNKYTGDLLLTKGQVWSQLFGLTVYPYDPEQSRELNMVFMQREIEDIQRNTKTKLRDQNLVNDEAKADQIREDAQERIRQKQEELQLYQQQSEVPKAFERDAKPKHQFLDLIGRVAPITDQKSKREAVRTILEAGHPALASLVEDLPVRLRPMVAAALREGRVNA